MAKMTEVIGRADDRHLAFFQLNHHPFPVAPDTVNFYCSENIEQTVAELVHGICSRKGFFVLTGDVGLGKTTISRRIVKLLEQAGVETAMVLHTSIQGPELLQAIIEDFGVPIDQNEGIRPTVGQLMRRLNEFVLQVDSQGKNCAIVIDDAQNLDRQSLELVRMISNLEADRKKLVQILLVGQPELEEHLRDHRLRQLDSRIMLRKRTRPLRRKELADYLAFKLTGAGNHGQVQVTKAALSALFRYSRGNLRRVNSLMDRCFYAAFARGQRIIDRAVVAEAAADLWPGRKLALRPPVWGVSAWAAVCVLLLALGILVVRQFGNGWTFIKAPIASGSAVAVADAAVKAVAEKSTSMLQTDQVAVHVRNFLKSYGLDEYCDYFQAAIRNDELERLGRKILAETGWQMVDLGVLGKDLVSGFNTLNLRAKAAGKSASLLFWRPPVILHKFYYDYTGPEIVAVQHALAGLGFYRGRLDGQVGRGLMRAVVDFQRQNGLPVTGRPDPATLFMMFKMQKKVSHG